MIKLIRVDYRLIHGQVAVSWVRKTGVDYLVVSDDNAASNSIMKTAMKLAQPVGIGMDILPTEKVIALTKKGRYQRKKVMVVCGNMKEAARLAIGIKDDENIDSIIIGNVKATEKSKSFNKAVDLNVEELESALEIVKNGVKVNLQLFPDTTPESLEENQILNVIKELKEGK
ncbi:PTS sugar transporter subunit IIB [Erysipelotrichaceae bacterium HCN-30851]